MIDESGRAHDAARGPQVVACCAPLVVVALAAMLLAWRQGPPGDRVGACGFGPTCRDALCHATYPIDDPPRFAHDLSVTDPPGPLPPAYVPGRAYDLRLSLSDPDVAHVAWGFELGPVISCPVYEQGGSIEVTDPGRTRLARDVPGLAFLTHSCTCVPEMPDCCGYLPDSAPGTNAWPFRWIAPPAGSGLVTFATAFNSANGDGMKDFDQISLTRFTMEEDDCPPPVADLRVTRQDCDMSSPGVPELRLSWTAQRPDGFVERTTDDRAALALPRERWADAGGDCLAIDGRALVFFSVAERCRLGSEGIH